MGHHPPAQRSCGRCEQPAVFRVALIGPDENPAVMLARRAHYRCTDHLHAGFTPAALEVVARGSGYVVVDAAFTVARSGGLCPCGLPADHRYPADGEPRACIDETVRIARYRPEFPPPATFATEPVPPLSVTSDEKGSDEVPPLALGRPLSDADADLYGPGRDS